MPTLNATPCIPNCPNRSIEPNCHATCKKYIKWVDEQKEKKKAIHEYKVQNNMHESKFLPKTTKKFAKNNPKKWR